MIVFLLKGILRDKSRSLLPIIITTIGVFLTVVLTCWINGILGDVVDMNARFTTGHVKVMTQAYHENAAQNPNDLALLDVNERLNQLQKEHPDMEWVSRIHFGGLIDVPDENGETKAQGPAVGWAIDFLSPNSSEIERLNIQASLVRGMLPKQSNEALLSDDFAKKLKIKIGETLTVFGSTMEGSMAFHNFKLVGTIRFGTSLLDRGSILVDIKDAQSALDMENAAGELLGYFEGGKYDNKKASHISTIFNAKYSKENDEFSPLMLPLKAQNNLASLLDYSENMRLIMISIFVFAMSIVLWNTGLLGGLRRYTEFGVRLALGESKGHIYRSMLYESFLIGVIGSTIGTILGLTVAYYLQENGLDFSAYLKNSSMMMPPVYRAIISPESFYLGFIPGLFSMVLGTALSGIGIYKRQTAQLFKELEV